MIARPVAAAIKDNFMHKITLYIFAFLFLFASSGVSAHQPQIIYNQKGDIQINNPEISQAFYDELKGQPREYFINFPAQGGPASGWELYINILVPDPENRDGRYSVKVSSEKDGVEQLISSTELVDEESWQSFYEPFGRDYYLKGPELEQQLSAGKYKIEVYSADNLGKYVLAVGKQESYNWQSILNIYWQLPLLKIEFFKTSVLQFFLTPFGIGGVAAIGALLIFLALIGYFISLIKTAIRHRQAKTLLLTSAGMQMKDEISKLLQKPTYDIMVAFITTASKPEENTDYLQRDLQIMREELRFNVEEIDIEGKKEHELMKLFALKDIIFVEGGNTFYLLKAMRACKFERVMRKLMKLGKVYIGASAGSMVAGKTIITSVWRSEAKGINRNIVKLRNLKGLNLVPFNLFVHYKPEYAEIIKKKMRWKWQRRKLRILTDDQAILVQGKEVALIGKGEAVVI